jgi:hypothetical protein
MCGLYSAIGLTARVLRPGMINYCAIWQPCAEVAFETNISIAAEATRRKDITILTFSNPHYSPFLAKNGAIK